MEKPSLDPPVADTAPNEPALTTYDKEHHITYLRLLDADNEGADWRKSPKSCFISIRHSSQNAPGAPGKATLPVPDG